MANRKLLVGFGFTLLGAATLCMLCAVSVLSVGFIRRESGATVEAVELTRTQTELSPSVSPSVGFAVSSSTPVSTEITAQSPTPIISSTLTISPSETPVIVETQTGTSTPVVLPSPTFTASPTSTIGPMAFDSWCVPWHTESTRAQVVQVLDGITIQVEIDEQLFFVRYIGLELPVQDVEVDFGAKSTEANRLLVEGQQVLLISDRVDRDPKGSLLRYVLAKSTFVNRAIVENGYALAITDGLNISCDHVFLEAESMAQSKLVGMWAPLSTPTRLVAVYPTATISHLGEVKITYIQPFGESWQDEEEYVEFKNTSPFPIQMEGWRLSNQAGYAFVFPKFTINPGGFCRIYTNLYVPEACGLSFYRLSPVWNDWTDCAYLRDYTGALVDMYCYGQ